VTATGNDLAARRAAIDALCDKNGRVTAAAVVEAARDPESPLHGCFDWDIGRAAEAHWINTARHLIASVRVNITVGTRVIPAVAFVRDPSAPVRSQGYRELSAIALRRDEAASVLDQEFSRISAAIQRARNIASVLDMEAELEAMFDDVLVAQKKLAAKTKRRRRAVAAEGKADRVQAG